MYHSYSVLVFGILLFTQASSASACGPNEYEQCYRVNLLIGKAKDCKCLPKVGGTIGQAGEATKKVTSDIISEVRKTPEAIASCLNNVGQCVNEILSAPLAQTVQIYLDGLYKQSEGRVQPFSSQFIQLAQPYYSVNLQGITSADNINTGHGMSVSYCDRIFFSTSPNLWTSRSDLHLVLHELEHTVQCQRRGRRTYLAEYILKATGDIIKSGSVNVHDMHDYEMAANAKADQLTPIIWNQIQNARRSANYGQPGSGTQYLPPPYSQQPPLQVCKTPYGTCQIPPVYAPPGASCYCNSQYGQVQGQAY